MLQGSRGINAVYAKSSGNSAYPYLLGQTLLFKTDLQVVLPAHFVSVLQAAQYAGELESLWARLPSGVQRFGCAFWFE